MRSWTITSASTRTTNNTTNDSSIIEAQQQQVLLAEQAAGQTNDDSESDGDTYDDDFDNECCYDPKFILKSLHLTNVIDTCIALLLLVYGSLLLIHQQSLKAFAIGCLIFGSMLLLPVILSEVSLLRTPTQKYRSLIVAMSITIICCITYGAIGIFGWLTPYISNYCIQHEHDLLIPSIRTDAQVDTFLLWIILTSFLMVAIQISRFFIMINLQRLLIEEDNEDGTTRIEGSSSSLTRRLLDTDPAMDDGGADDDDDLLFSIDERSLHSDPLWYSRTTPTSRQQTTATPTLTTT